MHGTNKIIISDFTRADTNVVFRNVKPRALVNQPECSRSLACGKALQIRMFIMCFVIICRGQLKCDGTHAETRFRLSGRKGRVHLNRPGGGVSSVDCWQLRCAHQR